MQLKEFVGKRFGQLVVVAELPRRRSPRGVAIRFFACICVCGSRTEVRAGNLCSGKVVSCGCYRPNAEKYKGIKQTQAYKSWRAVKIRCFCKGHVKYKIYGGRGITMCDRWMDFRNFYADMGECPDGMSIDRIDNSKGYEPGNCRWATRREQMNNRRKQVRVQVGGLECSVREYAESLGVSYMAVYNRIRSGQIPARIVGGEA